MTGEDFRFIAVAALACLLCACGGGGGSSTPAAVAPAVNLAPTARFNLQSSGTTVPLVVTVDASTSTDSDGQIVSYSWDFDGTQAIGQQAQFTFEDPGEFTIMLTITDDDGANGSANQRVTAEVAIATATLSGTVKILTSTAVDSDVNDRFTAPTSNNHFDTAQSLPSTVTLGGFANIAGTGEPQGNLFSSGDPADFYKVSLSGGELIALNIAEANADLDLRLWDDQRRIVDASLSLANTETISVPNPGSFYIEVLAVKGATNYVLFVGQNATSTTVQSNTPRLSDAFVAGELLVKHKRTQSAQRRNEKEPSLNNMRDLIVQFAEPADLSGPGLYALNLSNHATASALSSSDPALNIPSDAFVSTVQQQKLRTLMALKRAKQDHNIAYAELNRLVKPHADPNDSFFNSQWHYQAVNLPVAWDTTTGSEEVIVAVVDSGILLNHPDLTNKLVDGYDFISSATRALDGDGIDNDPSDPGDREFGGSSSFHGTHVAGTIGAQTNNNTGVAGVAWQTKLMPMRVLGQGGGSTFDIVQAVRYAAGLSNNSGQLPARKADIMNLSLGSSFSSQSEQDAYTAASQAGVIVIASAGNDSSTLPSYPAAYENVTSVSATTITNALANYSNTGGTIDVAAPGGSNVSDLNGDGLSDGVLSTTGDDSTQGTIEYVYGTLTGTSMAAPHVAGIAALMKAIHPDLTPAQFNTALITGDLTDDLGEPGRDDQYGYGLINAQKAVVAAARLANGLGNDPGPILVSSASTLNFGSFLDTLSLRLQNIGTGSVNVISISSPEAWISINAPGTTDGLGEYTVNIDRSGLTDGAYLGNVTVESDIGTIRISIIMQVVSITTTANAGLFYIILVDEEGANVVPPHRVRAAQGEYPFSISNVPAGQYRLFAGTDADDDAILCDAGEACGAFPTLDSPTTIAVNEDLSAVEFEAGFRVNLTTNNSTSRQGDTQTDDSASISTEDHAHPFIKSSTKNSPSD